MKRNALVLVAVVTLVVLGLVSYRIYDAQLTRIKITALLSDDMERLKGALQAQAKGVAVADAEAHATAAEAHVAALRSLKTSSVTHLADAADDALVASREIMRRQVNIERSRRGLLLGVDSLSRHMRTDHGAKDWPREAIRIKGSVDKDLRDYRIAVESYATLLDSFPASQARLAPFVPPSLLIEPGLISDARQQALDAYKSTDQNIKKVVDISAYRDAAASHR